MDKTMSPVARATGVLMMLGLAGVSLACNSKVKATTKVPSDVPRAAVAIVKREQVSNQLSIAGEFFPYQEVEIHAKVAGFVRKINVDIGDHVRAGEVMAVLEVPELNAQVIGAQAGVRHATEEIVRAKNEVARAEADHAALHAAAIRLQQAAAARPGLIAQQELDDATAKDRASEAQVESSKSALAATEQQLEMSKATQSQVAAMQDYSRITAPFDGVVTWRYADTGALIQAGTTNTNSEPVVKLAEVDVLRLRIPVPEQLAPQVHVGMPAKIHIQATGEEFEGKVTRYTDSLDRSTRTEQVEIDVANKDGKLAPGMYANVELQVDARPDAITVPVQALMQNGDKASVMVVNPENKIELREVKTGVSDPNRVEVVAGLHDGERVVVGNLGAYQAGEVVEPKQSVITGVTD
jgi:RND family efflux transporter MFP subunit